MDWIDAKTNPPKKAGWYKIKMPLLKEVEYEAPFVRNAKGELIWVVPDEGLITHWSEVSQNKKQ